MLAVLCQLACFVSSALPVGMFCFCKLTCHVSSALPVGMFASNVTCSNFACAMHSQDVLLSGKASRNMQLKK